MVTGCITIRRHGQTKFELHQGPDVNHGEQRKAFKVIKGAGKSHPDIAEAHLYSSFEPRVIVRFQDPKAMPPPAPPVTTPPPVTPPPTRREKTRKR